MLWKTKGMNKDLSVSAFNPDFAFENMNLRLSTNEHNTLLSWVNEKGTKEINIVTEGDTATFLNIEGTPVGTAVIDHKLVVFTHNEVVENNTTIYTDKIYLLKKYQSNNFVGKVLYSGDLNLRESNPLETLVSYEMDTVEKVYWVDGRNQPRVINIKGKIKDGVDTQFDFVPVLGLKETITISKRVSSGGGLFAPGVIQYGITYVNKYGQESNVAVVSALQYLSHADRGAKPDEMVTDSFIIQINDVDQNFDYVRLYSIQRTSLNGVPFVKFLEEFPTSSGGFSEERIYSEDPFADSFQYTLPPVYREEDLLKLKRVIFKNGYYYTDYSVARTTNRLGYSPNRSTVLLDFYYYQEANPSVLHYIMSLQQLMYNLMVDSTHPGYADYIDVHHSYVRVPIDGVIKGILLNGIVTQTTPKIALKISDNEVILENKILDNCLVYDLWKGKWFVCKNEVSEIKIGTGSITYEDSGTTGSTVDPQSLLFIGGREITALTMIDKDNTLFLGNIEEKNNNTTGIQSNFDYNSVEVTFSTDADIKMVKRDKESPNDKEGFYSYQSQLNNSRRQITTFKGGEIYRFGFQLQKKTGEWSEPILLGDYENDKYPASKVYEDNIPLSFASANINVSKCNPQGYHYKRIRPVVVYPTIADRQVLCQGVLNPTVFNVEDRKQKLPFAQASWYFRPYMADANSRSISGTEHQKSQYLEYVHYNSLPSEPEAQVVNSPMLEIQGSMPIYTSVGLNPSALYESNIQFFVDQSIVTLNSPDIEFDTEVQNYSTDGLKLRIIGAIPITGNVSAHKIESSSGIVQMGLNNENPPTPNQYGQGELTDNTLYQNINSKAGNRLVSDFLWEDVVFTDASTDETPKTQNFAVKYLVYPWQRTGPLNNDPRTQDKASSWLKKKMESNLLYSINTEYFVSDAVIDFENYLSTQFHLTENNFITNIRLPQQVSTSSEINYYPNIDKILTTTKTLYDIESSGRSFNGYLINLCDSHFPNNTIYTRDVYHPTALPISMKYKSTSHAVIAFNDIKDEYHHIPILPYGTVNGTNIGEWTDSWYSNTFWGDTNLFFTQSSINMDDLFLEPHPGEVHHQHVLNWLWLGELYKKSVNPFGGTDRNAILANNWVVGGDAVDLPDIYDNNTTITLKWTEGDTYFQRYDCLKTYAFTPEDTNQLVEILSFMVETHVNLDGRYDKNRGQQISYLMSPENFNLINDVYSQKDNFFSYKKTDIDATSKKYPNQIAYTLTKTSGADVDAWTNMSLGSTLELDGDKGSITKLIKLNDKLLAFQDSGISQIMYNENVQVSTEQGVPIEIANSGKVQGARYLSNTVGCSNKWSVVQTPSGIYFMDSNDKSIYLLGDGLKNITEQGGFNTWAKQNISTYKIGEPLSAGAFKAFYDRLNQEVFYINKDTSLAWSEKIGAFTSFYDYGNAPYFVNLDDEGYWLNISQAEPENTEYKLWKHQGGEYCNFFDVNKDYYTVLVGNPQPQADKIFTNLEFRACVGDGESQEQDSTLLPFDSLETWNEYQHGETKLHYNRMPEKHFQSNSNALNRKFRIWRCDIPRDGNKKLDRMRNPWLYLKLMKNKAGEGTLPRVEIHDVGMNYFV